MTTSPNARRLTIAALAAAVCAVAPAAWADDAGPLTRAEVAAATVAAIRAGEVMPAGERVAREHYTSTKTREERKAETLLARSRDELTAGGIGAYRDNIRLQGLVAKSTKTRDERKAETLQAIERKQMPRAGEIA